MSAKRAALTAVAAGLILCGRLRAAADADSAASRVDALLARMSLSEKIALLHGVPEPAATDQGQAGYLAGLARLGIAHDAAALGIDVVLEPYINLDRDPTFGRAYNTYGEDPLLTGVIGAALIRGIQGAGIMAQAKHYLAYNGANDPRLEPQALHEIYAAPFEAAVAAGVSSIMCSYNHVNGVSSCGNRATLTDLLRDELHFEGFVTSDWGAYHASSSTDQAWQRASGERAIVVAASSRDLRLQGAALVGPR
jgi:beta-glucosidase